MLFIHFFFGMKSISESSKAQRNSWPMWSGILLFHLTRNVCCGKLFRLSDVVVIFCSEAFRNSNYIFRGVAQLVAAKSSAAE